MAHNRDVLGPLYLTVLRITAFLFLTVAIALAFACSSKTLQTPPSPTQTADPNEISLGLLGELPAQRSSAAGPKLVYPIGVLELPATYPLGSHVKFQIPLRNDGSEPLLIDKIEPG